MVSETRRIAGSKHYRPMCGERVKLGLALVREEEEKREREEKRREEKRREEKRREREKRREAKRREEKRREEKRREALLAREEALAKSPRL
ncbi:hypothetical protein DUI87_12596 [Hirundo rustica rustica]|uniref:Uncharacterized protein n=1 Tax=Hirundo rustica rustica TaxID=333673 RepID=A0A3M0KCG4_HIRRU|nr:hypothetical protein DUI87_12596 [Hirundo rustica rustica]